MVIDNRVNKIVAIKVQHYHNHNHNHIIIIINLDIILNYKVYIDIQKINIIVKKY